MRIAWVVACVLASSPAAAQVMDGLALDPPASGSLSSFVGKSAQLKRLPVDAGRDLGFLIAESLVFNAMEGFVIGALPAALLSGTPFAPTALVFSLVALTVAYFVGPLWLGARLWSSDVEGAQGAYAWILLSRVISPIVAVVASVPGIAVPTWVFFTAIGWILWTFVGEPVFAHQFLRPLAVPTELDAAEAPFSNRRTF